MSSETFRFEQDSLGTVRLPIDAPWGAQTERSRQNFKAGEKMPLSLIRILLHIKAYAAQVNESYGLLSNEKSRAIQEAIHQLLSLPKEELRRAFPLVIYQTGSGTQTNMNVNEVVARRANLAHPHLSILPNDDVNKGQSSNDVFPTAMAIAASLSIQSLQKALQVLIHDLVEKEKTYWKTVKIGRTHLQDATPLTVGQEISGYVSTLKHDRDFISQLLPSLYELPIGGTAVGTGLNAIEGYSEKITEKLARHYKLPFTSKENKFYGLASHSALNVVHGSLKTLASDLLKIANDIRFLGSGPRSGYDEFNLPQNEPGSSIMPGKVNPTQAEALTMIAARVMGNDVTLTIASSQGNFEMNVYKPVIISSFLESTSLLAEGILSFSDKMIKGLTLNETVLQEEVKNSLMTVTALSPHIGYEQAAKLAQKAEKEQLTLEEAAKQVGMNMHEFYKWMDPLKMTNLDQTPFEDE